MACCWHQWSAVCPRGKQAAAGTMGLPSLGCSAEKVSFVLRFVRANAGREGGPEGAQREPHSVSCPDGWFLRTLLPEEAHSSSRQSAGGIYGNRCWLEWRRGDGLEWSSCHHCPSPGQKQIQKRATGQTLTSPARLHKRPQVTDHRFCWLRKGP